MPDPYTPCGRATPQKALRLFGGWLARRAGGLRPSSSPLDTPSLAWPDRGIASTAITFTPAFEESFLFSFPFPVVQVFAAGYQLINQTGEWGQKHKASATVRQTINITN
jgi:hypothetical protein